MWHRSQAGARKSRSSAGHGVAIKSLIRFS